MGNRIRNTWLRSVGARLRNSLTDRRGVAAVEFAFIAPVLLCLYFMTMEIAQGIETNKKVGRVASMVADLITQQQNINKNDIDAIMQIGEATLQPYNRSEPTIIVTGIDISDDPTPIVTVEWSRKLVNGVAMQDQPAGNATTVPSDLKIPGTFLVRVEADLDYRPMIAWAADSKQTLGLMSAFDNINMAERYYLRPRMSNSIPCNDC
jgi:Flp pilus assembly protein TadG